MGMKREKAYEECIKDLDSLLEQGVEIVSNLANASAYLHAKFGFLWTGFYLVSEGALILGPFQGPVACTRIEKGKGVCGTSLEKSESIVVPDVHQFPGHISCSPLSKSEVVVPVYNKEGSIIAVLDIDSEKLKDFDEEDKRYLEKISSIITSKIEDQN